MTGPPVVEGRGEGGRQANDNAKVVLFYDSAT